MRRLSLSTKLFAAALPLVVAVGALLVFTAQTDLEKIDRAETGARLGSVWAPLSASLNAVEAENAATTWIGTSPEAAAVIAEGRRATDQAIDDLRISLTGLRSFDAASEHITTTQSALSATRRDLDLAVSAPETLVDNNPEAAYNLASRTLVSVGQLLPAESGSAELGEELLAVAKLAEAKLAANSVAGNAALWPNATEDRTGLVEAATAFVRLETLLGEFLAVAPDEWTSAYRRNGFGNAITNFGASLTDIRQASEQGMIETFDSAGFSDAVDDAIEFQITISESIVERASIVADQTRQETLIRSGIILAAVLFAGLVAWFLTRSVTRRVKAVAQSANQVARVQMPALVEALRDPRGKAVLPEIAPVSTKGSDEVADLAYAFNSMQGTLVDVAQQQVEVLRRGVSDIFITMARRNRSLIDRQLAMLDEFEAEVDDPKVLANYYQLDHLSTRMRRNSESLLVLANADPKQRRVKATEIDDVVRASIGEVEDYRRVEIETLEHLQVRGNVVADISHILAELIDNATAFSPPDSSVRVGGRRAGDSYMLRIVDNGVGIGANRMKDFNELLIDPPIVGLSVESTLGMSVVSLLANKHSIGVNLSAGNPGLTVDVTLPSSLFGPIEVPTTGQARIVSVDEAPRSAPPEPDEVLVDWQPTVDTDSDDDSFVPASEFEPYERELEPSAAAPALSELPAVDSAQRMAINLSGIAASAHSSTAGPDLTDSAEFTSELVGPDAKPIEVDPEIFALPSDDQLSFADVPPSTPLVPNLPPPSFMAVPPSGEFDRQPAPPALAGGPSQRPVTPVNARPALPLNVESRPTAPSLPTRAPSNSPDGPDRLEDALSAASANRASRELIDLEAFKGRKSDLDELPTRARTTGEPSNDDFEEAASIGKSRLDPEALRDRLRSFQTEFQTASSASADSDEPETDEADPYDFNQHLLNQQLLDHNSSTDLGGDRR
jgi:signal transduction histidine kinase